MHWIVPSHVYQLAFNEVNSVQTRPHNALHRLLRIGKHSADRY